MRRLIKLILLITALTAGLLSGCKPAPEAPPSQSQTTRPDQPDPFRAANVRDNTPQPTPSLAFPPLEPVPTNAITVATLNCYWFLGAEESDNADKPRTTADYNLKAGHLIGLFPPVAPFFVGLQEIGNAKDVQALAYSATRRYQRDYTPLFVQGNDTATGQDVGALFDTTRGWGVKGQPFRSAELEQALSKHLVVRLTNATTQITFCVVHLRVPSNPEAIEKQNAQNRALATWALSILAFDYKANLAILGDFNEDHPAGSKTQSLAPILKVRPAINDVFAHFKGTPVTHPDDKAYDRILVSDAMFGGRSRLRMTDIQILKHATANSKSRALYTDHYPVVATFETR